MKKLNLFFFGFEKIHPSDAAYFYGILGGAVVVNTLLLIILW